MQQQNYQTPASALYEYTEEPGSSAASGPMASAGRAGIDPTPMMESYMKKVAQEEKRRQPKQSKDEMPRPPSLQGRAIRKKGDITWVITFHKNSSRSSWLPVMMQLHRKLQKRLQRGQLREIEVREEERERDG